MSTDQITPADTPELSTAPATPAKTGKPPSMLSVTRGLSPGHFMMFSARKGLAGRAPILVRKETAIGPQGTASTSDEAKVLAVPARLESAELAPGDDTLILEGSVRISSLLHRLTACNSPEFTQKHAQVMQQAVKDGVAAELAKRYAITLLSGLWGWRNSDSASAVTVNVSWGMGADTEAVQAKDLLLSQADAFAVEQYPEHKETIERLAAVILSAMTSERPTAFLLNVTGQFFLGTGAVVYPSQEWADKKPLGDKEDFPLSRALAKMQLPDGELQVFMTERKIGNQLRRIDTWYKGATPGQPIAVEAYGANVRESRCMRPSKDDIFSMVKLVAAGKVLDTPALSYYAAMAMRGGVFSGSK